MENEVQEDFQAKYEAQKIRTVHLEALLDHLKAQVRPHFLFNTLNHIYYEMRKGAPAQADAVLYLSEILHYSIDNDRLGALVAIEKEIEQVETIINLRQLRSNNEYHLSFIKNGNFDGIKIPALLLVILIENMFKYGQLEKETPGLLSIALENNTLKILSQNVVIPDTSVKLGGTSLKLVDERLKALYKDKAAFKYGLVANQFVVTIELLNV